MEKSRARGERQGAYGIGSWNVNRRQLSVIVERGGRVSVCGEGRLGITAEIECHSGERRNGCHARLSEALMVKQREEKLTVTVEGTSYGKSQCKVV